MLRALALLRPPRTGPRALWLLSDNLVPLSPCTSLLYLSLSPCMPYTAVPLSLRCPYFLSHPSSLGWARRVVHRRPGAVSWWVRDERQRAPPGGQPPRARAGERGVRSGAGGAPRAPGAPLCRTEIRRAVSRGLTIHFKGYYCAEPGPLSIQPTYVKLNTGWVWGAQGEVGDRGWAAAEARSEGDDCTPTPRGTAAHPPAPRRSATSPSSPPAAASSSCAPRCPTAAARR